MHTVSPHPAGSTGCRPPTHPTGWWTCLDCGVEAELPAPDTAGFLVPCPDCDREMAQLWSWEPRLPPARPLPRAA